jgi:hypothetical protein
MVGTNENSVSYPTFINDPSGNLYFIFRDGTSGNGDLYMYKYNHGATTWAGVTGTTAGKVIDGKSESPTRNAYWDHPCFDANFGSGGFLHLSWHSKTSTQTAGASGNRDRSYVRWDGTNWTKADGTSQTIPITSTNAEIIDNSATDDTGMISFSCLYSDSSGHPHIIYSKTSGGSRYLFQAYHNGVSWSIGQITSLHNAGTDITNGEVGLIPCVVINRSNDTIYVFYKDVKLDEGIWMLKSTNFSTWTNRRVYPYGVGWWIPKFDYVEFERSGNLYFSVEEFYGSLLIGIQTAFPIYVWKVAPGNL